MTDPVIAALIGAGGGAFVALVKAIWDAVTHRDERVFQKQLAAAKITLEGQVKLIVDAHLKVHDANLRVAAEWRLNMLVKMLEAGGDLRTRLNESFAALGKLSRQAHLEGPTQETLAVVRNAEEVIRKVNTVGGFLPPNVTEVARSLLERFDGILREIAGWANLKTKSERDTACDRTDKKIVALGCDMTRVFGEWHAGMWQVQEQLLQSFSSTDGPKLIDLPDIKTMLGKPKGD